MKTKPAKPHAISKKKIKSRRKVATQMKKKWAAKAPTPRALKKPARSSTRAAASKLSVMPGGERKTDSDIGLYVRFGGEKDRAAGVALKARVKAAAEKAGVTMNAFIVACTVDWVEKGKTPPSIVEAKEETEPAAATGT